ncbi:PepSY domain-containing protein [Candidatus Woesearchaeota archaeon]|nr:PepSY domain-containing protein [Candidatus Woesearchaeota archaeon]
MLKETISRVEKSKEYEEWHAKNPDFYLAHAFTMLDEKHPRYAWELGYYSPSRDKLVVVETEPSIAMRPEEDVFKKDGRVAKLSLSEIKIRVADAMKICDDLVKSDYSSQVVNKRIILVQNQPKHVYNVTLVTHTFSILNVKIDAGTGEVLGHKLQSIMDLGAWQKGDRPKS